MDPIDYEIAPMRPDEYEQCIDLVSLAFTTKNPSYVHTQVPFEVFREFASVDCTREACVESGLSLVARSKSDGEVLAVLFLKTFRLAQLPERVFSHPGMLVAKEMVEALYEAAVLNPFGMCLGSMVSGMTLHAALGGTAPGAGGRGMGKALRSRALRVAREKGYNSFVVEPFHPATRHIWTEHCGCAVMAELPMDTFVSKSRVGGQKPYAGIGGSGSIAELVLRRSMRDWPIFWPVNLIRLVLQAEAIGNLWSAIKMKVGGWGLAI